MRVAVDVHQQRQELSGLVAEPLRAGFGDIQNDRNGFCGLRDHAFDPQRLKPGLRHSNGLWHPTQSINYLR